MNLLGIIVGRGGNKIDSGKCRAIKGWTRLKTLTESRVFFVFAQFFRIFIRTFSGITWPLTYLTRKNYGLKDWSGKCDTALEELKIALTIAPILMAPDWSKPFFFHVEASELATGATFTQGDDRRKVIAYAS